MGLVSMLSVLLLMVLLQSLQFKHEFIIDLCPNFNLSPKDRVIHLLSPLSTGEAFLETKPGSGLIIGAPGINVIHNKNVWQMLYCSRWRIHVLHCMAVFDVTQALSLCSALAFEHSKHHILVC